MSAFSEGALAERALAIAAQLTPSSTLEDIRRIANELPASRTTRLRLFWRIKGVRRGKHL